MRNRCLSLALLALFAVPGEAGAAQSALEIEGHLARETSSERMERKVLRRSSRVGGDYRALSEFYVFRIPSMATWDGTLGPAFEGALEGERPLESLRSLLMALDDSEVLLAGPDVDGVRVDLSLPGDRGEGFFSVVPPPLLGPDRRLTNLNQPDKLLALSGLAAQELPRRAAPDIVQLGFHSAPIEWRGGELRRPKLKEIEDRGAGAWVKYKGRTHSDGEDLERAYGSVRKELERTVMRADKMRVWPGGGDDDQRFSDLLRAARYRTRRVEFHEDAIKQFRTHRDDWEWTDRQVKHPTRYGMFTFSVAAERDDGRKFQEVVESFGLVVFYTPFFLDLDEAHLYLQVAPEQIVSAVQEGQLPFFEAGRGLRFYRGHLDRWLEGVALDSDPSRSLSRREVPRRIDSWASRMDGKQARAFGKLAENPAHWPLRMLPSDSDNPDVLYRVRVDERDLASWLHRLLPSFSPKGIESDFDWTLEYAGEAERVQIDDLFSAPRLRLSKSAGVVAGMPAAPSVSKADRAKRAAERERREEARAAALDRRRSEEETERRRVADQKYKSEDEVGRRRERGRSTPAEPERRETRNRREAPVDSERREEEQRREARAAAEQTQADRRAEERRAAEEAEEERLAALDDIEGDIDVQVTAVVLGSPRSGEPYLLTRAGRTLPLKVTYKAGGDVSGHKLQVRAQGHDLKGAAMKDFVAKSAEVVPEVGEGSVTTYIKVPRNLSRSTHMGSYRVDISVMLDGVALASPKTELLRLGSVVQLPVAFLDPAVVTPSDTTELMMNLDLGGWGSSERVPVVVKVEYTLGKTTRTQSFTITRGVGRHYLGVGIDTPEDLPIGEGRYRVTVTAGGTSKSQRGSLLVLDPEMVAQRRGYAGRGRGRIEESSAEFDALVASIKGAPIRREYVRPDTGKEEVGDWDFGDEEDFDFDEDDSPSGKGAGVFEDDFDLDSSAEEIEEREREEERRLQEERERAEAQAEAGRRKKRQAAERAEAARRAEAEQAEDARQAELDARAEEDRRAEAKEQARAKEARRRAKKASREKKKRKDLPPEEDEDDFDFDDLVDDEDPEYETEAAPRKGSRRGGRSRKPAPKDRASRGKRRAEPESDVDLDDEPEGDVLALAESEQLDEEDLPDFVYNVEDEFDVLLAAEAEALGVLYIDGAAAKRTLVWLEEWEAAEREGAPEWLWIIDDGASANRLRFRRYSGKAGAWKTVFEMPPSFADRSEERAARATMRRVLRGYVPSAERMISFDSF